MYRPEMIGHAKADARILAIKVKTMQGNARLYTPEMWQDRLSDLLELAEQIETTLEKARES